MNDENNETQMIDLENLFEVTNDSGSSPMFELFLMRAYPSEELVAEFVRGAVNTCAEDKTHNLGKGIVVYGEDNDAATVLTEALMKIVNMPRTIRRADIGWNILTWYAKEILGQNVGYKGWDPDAVKFGKVSSEQLGAFIKRWLEEYVIEGEVESFCCAYPVRQPNGLITNMIFEYKAEKEGVEHIDC